jgi:hypothetical protein
LHLRQIECTAPPPLWKVVEGAVFDPQRLHCCEEITLLLIIEAEPNLFLVQQPITHTLADDQVPEVPGRILSTTGQI